MILAENPGKSLDDLVEEKKINNDQKAQALKKPILQASVIQLEEQITQCKRFASYYEDRLSSQKAALEKAYKEELEAVQEKITAEVNASATQDFRDRLLVLSQFLRAAATMRRSGDETSSENRAFEGVLFQVYGGSQDAVDAMLKLIEAADEKVPSVEGDPLEVTCESRLRPIEFLYLPVSGLLDVTQTCLFYSRCEREMRLRTICTGYSGNRRNHFYRTNCRIRPYFNEHGNDRAAGLWFGSPRKSGKR